MQYSVKHNYDFWLPVLEQGPIRNKSLQKDNKVNLFYKGEKIVFETKETNNEEKKEGKNEINLGKREKNQRMAKTEKKNNGKESLKKLKHMTKSWILRQKKKRQI